jgi:hypothetical protein
LSEAGGKDKKYMNREGEKFIKKAEGGAVTTLCNQHPQRLIF